MEKLTFEECIKSRKGIDKKLDYWGAKLDSFPKLDSGLIPDIYKKTPEYQEARKQFAFWFSQLRDLNKYIIKNYKKENYTLHMKNRQEKINAKK